MSPAKILIVEDEVMLAKELARKLKDFGYEVVGAVGSGEDAVQRAEETLPDLILMDIKLDSEMDGIEAATLICSRLDTAIVYLTAHTTGDVFERAKITKPHAFLTKPVSHNELRRVVEMALYKRRMDRKLRESEARVRMKLEAILRPEGDIGVPDLGDVIDSERIQALMDDFYRLTNLGVAILDRSGKVLVATGWQDICTRFHRVHPETRRNCKVSDTELSSGTAEGTFKLYRCKNNMWDISTPIMVGGKHLGNLFLGQFFFQDEQLDHEVFRSQARRYGFDEERYMAALESVPRWSRDTVERVMSFYTKFTEIVSDLSYSNIQLARSLVERDRLVASLQESEARYRYLFENSPVGIISVDREGRILQANQSLLDILGSPSTEETKSINMFELPQLIESGISQAFQTCMDSGEPLSKETPYTSKWGKTIHFKLMLTPLYDRSGEVIGCQAVAEDVTQQKLLEKQLLEAQKLQSIGTLAGGIAHDFNNILQVVLGYSDVLLFDKTPGTQEYEELLAIRRAAKHGSNLANRILAFSRRLEPNARPLRLTNELNRMKTTLSRIIPKMIKVEMILGDDVKMIGADLSQMEQVLLNLALNAQHAMPDGGILTIEVSNVTLDEEYCGGHVDVKPGEYVLLSVSDTGHGMEKEVRDRIFEPFYTTRGPGGGTGLGLAMVYGIVKGHGGHIGCYSEPKCGTTFRIYLPVIAEALEPRPDLSGEMPAFGTETLLLADDEEGVRSLGERILSRHGYTVLTAANGKEALDIYRHNRDDISLVILDLIMPEMGGKQCLTEMLKIDPNLRVLVTSGYSAGGPTEDALQGGAKGFLKKPFEAKHFLRTVRALLDGR